MRIKDALTEAGIPFTPNVYICLRSLGGTFRLVDFVIYTKHGIIYLEIGKPVTSLHFHMHILINDLDLQMSMDISVMGSVGSAKGCT